MRKRIIPIIIIVILSLMMASCHVGRTYRFENHPTSQPNSAWETKDGRVRFYCGADATDLVSGVVEVEGTIVEVCFSITPQTTDLIIWYPDDASDGVIEGFARGIEEVINDREFFITITSAEAIFEEGTVLLFYRTE